MSRTSVFIGLGFGHVDAFRLAICANIFVDYFIGRAISAKQNESGDLNESRNNNK